MVSRFAISVFLLLGISCAFAQAQEPVVNGVVPTAIAPGASTLLQVNGDNLALAKKIWVSFPCETVLADGIEKNGELPNQVTYRINVPGDTPCGIHAFRVVTDKGVSPLKFLFLDDLPAIASVGSNTQFANAQVVSLPASIGGVVPGLNWQYFKFAVQAGQRLSIEVVARRLGSSLDPIIRLLDAKGRELAYNDDTPGLSSDASIVYTFKDAGEYLIELRDIKYGGGGFQLRIGDFPVGTAAFPMAVQRGVATNLTLAGYGVDGLVPVTITAPAEQTADWLSVSVKRPNGGSGFSTVAVVNTPQFLEQEPNNSPDLANRIDLTQDINGRLEQAGDIDRFIFTAKKDQSITFVGITRQQGSPTDLNLKILNKDGGQLATADDSGTNEGSLTYKFPADGDYTLVVADLNHRGGSEHVYRIVVTPEPAQLTLNTSLDTFNIPAGGSVVATVTAVRTVYNGPIELTAINLPAGVTASRSVIGSGRNDAVMTLQSTPDFAPGELYGISIVGTAKLGAADVVVPAEITSALKARNNNMRWIPSTLNKYVVASSAPAPGFVWKVEPDTLVFGKDLSAKAKLIATRAAGFDEPITLAILPPQNGLPPGVTLALKNIEKGQNEVEIVVSGNNQAPLGEFTAGVTGTLKQGNKTVTQGMAIRLNLAAPLSLKLDPAGGKIAKGGELLLKAIVERNPAFSGPVNVVLQNLPAGVSAAAATIAADQTMVELKLTATADAAAASVNNLTVKGDAMVGPGKYETTSPAVMLVVE